MNINSNSFFPNQKFVHFNLNELFLSDRKNLVNTKNPQLVQDFLAKHKKEVAYGGWSENRQDVWHGTYLDKNGDYIHLGVDINNKLGTPVICPFDCEVIDKYTDIDEKMGWGGRLILKIKNNLLCIAHLAPETLTNHCLLKQGQILGHVGNFPTNGNTFRHIHIQAFKKELNDGYGSEKDLIDNPNPFTIDY